MKEELSRTEKLIGEEALLKLKRSRVAVFGLGGVGGHVVEALARSGIGSLDLIDKDTVDLSNINRQLIALHSTVGRYKTEAFAERIAAPPIRALPQTNSTFPKVPLLPSALRAGSGRSVTCR